MKHLLSAFVVVVFLFLAEPAESFSLLKGVDANNTYQWNRNNIGTSKIDKNPWYEWWYYKVIDEQSGNSFYFCYGVVNPWDKDGKTDTSRAFVSFGDFSNHLILSTSVPVKDFYASYDAPFVQVGRQLATENILRASFEDKGHQVSWDLAYDKKVGWDSMGWGLRFKNLFNIYWHTAQMDAKVHGTITVDGKQYTLKNADGYQDRNWGRRFPKWWYWIVSNSFKENKESSFASGGGHAELKSASKVPLPTAILMALKHEGRLYEFRSSDFRHSFDWQIDLGSWHIKAKNPWTKIKVTASVDPEKMMDLQFDTPDGKIFHDYETLRGSLHVELFKKRIFSGWKKIADLTTEDSAGLELGLDHIYEPSTLLQGSIGEEF